MAKHLGRRNKVCRQSLSGFHSETVFFRPGGVNLRSYLCGIPTLSLSLWERVANGRVRASVQPLDFLARTKKILVSELETDSFPSGVTGWKLSS